ncbi:MAG: hypothetical protein JO262_19395 [Solirubrobacterales bacterium]|nr:hypothetical protein [Solirubrobacterales bacterium]
MTLVAAERELVPDVRSPFQGLEPYGEEDAAFFFGREEWREIIIDNLRAYRLTLLYGASGVGKSSVLRAAVVHELRRRARRRLQRTGVAGHAVAIVYDWREDPLGQLIRCVDEAVADYPEDLPDTEEASDVSLYNVASGSDGGPGGLPSVGCLDDSGLLVALKRSACRAGGRLFVILDQFEEYFLYHPRAEPDSGFESALVTAINRQDLQAHFLVSIREDAMAELDRFKVKLPNLFDNYLRIGPLSRDEARAAISEPLSEYNARARTRYRVADDLVEAILTDVQSDRVIVGRGGTGVVALADENTARTIEAPYLQLVLTRLWDEELRQGSQVLRLETFEDLGQTKAIVRAHLDAAMANLSMPQQDTAARMLDYLVTPSGTKIAQSAADLARYARAPEDEVGAILNTLSGGRLRILRPAAERRYEIYHDALATPILDWCSRWQRKQERIRQRRQLEKFAVAAGVCLVGIAVVVFLLLEALAAKRDAQAAQHRAQVASARATDLGLASTAETLLGTRPDVSLIVALAAYHRNPQLAAVRASMSSALEAAVLSGAERILHGFENSVTSVAFDPTRQLLASASADGTVHLWNPHSGKQTGNPLKVASGGAFSVAFSPDGRELVAGDQAGTVRFWSLATGTTAVPKLNLGSGPIISLAISRDGQRLAAASLGSGVRLVKLAGGLPVGPPIQPPNTSAVRAVAFSPDSRVLGWAGGDGSLALLDPATGRLLRGPALVPHEQFYAAAFLTNDELAAGGQDRQVRIWRLPGGGIDSYPSGAAGAINQLALSPDGHTLATAMSDDSVLVWNVGTGVTPGAPLVGHTGLVTSVAFTARDMLASGSTDRTVRLWGYPPSAEAGITVPRPQYVASLAIARDASRLFAGGPFGIRSWPITALRSPGVALPNAGDVKAVAVDSRATTLVAGAIDPNGGRGSIREWNLSSGTQTFVARLQGPGLPVQTVALSRDAHLLAYAGDGGVIYLWDLVHRRSLSTLNPRAGKVFSVAFSPDGTLLASAGDDRLIRLWNLRTGKQIRQFAGDSDAIFSVAFSPDGRRLASGSADDTVRLWNVFATGSETGQVGQPLTGHHDYVWSVAFSPDGSTLASGSQDGSVRLWDVASRAQLGQPVGGGNSLRIATVAFSSNGDHLFAGGEDHVVRVWPVVVLPRNYVNLQSQVCKLVVTGLSPAEWSDYAPRSDYSDPCR